MLAWMEILVNRDKKGTLVFLDLMDYLVCLANEETRGIWESLGLLVVKEFHHQASKEKEEIQGYQVLLEVQE
jgi:hypothetical protein